MEECLAEGGNSYLITLAVAPAVVWAWQFYTFFDSTAAFDPRLFKLYKRLLTYTMRFTLSLQTFALAR
jgi:hypothetical protein